MPKPDTWQLPISFFGSGHALIRQLANLSCFYTGKKCKNRWKNAGVTINKMRRYRRETVLQSVLVLVESRRLELQDNILRTLYEYFQPLWHNLPAKLSNSMKKRK